MHIFRYIFRYFLLLNIALIYLHIIFIIVIINLKSTNNSFRNSPFPLLLNFHLHPRHSCAFLQKSHVSPSGISTGKLFGTKFLPTPSHSQIVSRSAHHHPEQWHSSQSVPSWPSTLVVHKSRPAQYQIPQSEDETTWPSKGCRADCINGRNYCTLPVLLHQIGLIVDQWGGRGFARD